MRIDFAQTSKLRLGTLDTSLFAVQSFFPSIGIMTNSGHSIFGLTPQLGVLRAAVTIGPPVPPIPPALSLEVLGLAHFIGMTNQFGFYNCIGIATFTGITIKSGLDLTSGAKIVNGGLIVNGILVVNGFAMWTASIVGTSKLFDIKHPTKGEGHRLAHGSLEGPELGVYYRGRLKDSTRIDLPSYWKDLVDEDSVTVQLQPIGDRHFHLNVVDFTNQFVTIKDADDKPIDCFYTVYGERKDVDKLIVEYEGDKPMQQGGPKE